MLLAAALALAACSEAPASSEPGGGQLGVRMSFQQAAGCEPLPAGVLPADVALVELLLKRTADGNEVGSFGLLVDPLARCQDEDGREFPCPFDEDGDGLRERYYALPELPTDMELQLEVTLKNDVSDVLWQGVSEPVRCSSEHATIVSVQLRPARPECAPR